MEVKAPETAWVKEITLTERREICYTPLLCRLYERSPRMPV
jgi:hypothetical protein